MRTFIVVAATLAVAFSACSRSSEPERVDENAAPTDYTEVLLNQIRKLVGDPTGIRDAYIAGPELRPVDGKTQRQVVCVRFNPRDEKGAYIGDITRVGIFYAGELASFVADRNDVCRGVNYRPFPELMQLCKELVCPKPR